MKTYKQSLLAVFLGLLIIAGVSYASWTGPVSVPPAGNTDAPLNVGSLTQYKSGALGIGGLFRAYDQAIFDGQVKITGGTPGVGKVLTSDANGVASWNNKQLKVYSSFIDSNLLTAFGYFINNPSAWSDLGLSITLVPTSANSKFLINATFTANALDNIQCYLALFRDDTYLAAPLAMANGRGPTASSVTYVDSMPNYSQRTYKIKAYPVDRCVLNKAYTHSMNVLEIPSD